MAQQTVVPHIVTHGCGCVSLRDKKTNEIAIDAVMGEFASGVSELEALALMLDERVLKVRWELQRIENAIAWLKSQGVEV